MVEFERPELTELKPRISVIGVGGAGGNAVANMIQSGLEGVDFVVANTDAQALAASLAETRIQLGHKITQGLGAGARPEIGRAAAEENAEEIETALNGSHMCFITAGMGGGTGTGAAPVIAQYARERGILTVGVVTKPFGFEGAKRSRAAESGIEELQKHVDTLIVIPNQNLFMIASPQTTFKEAFEMADQVLHQGVRGITDLMMMPGLINLDFADVRTVMSEMGKAMMGTGEAEGENRAIEAANKAISNPLLDEVSLRGAKALLINITGGDDMGLMEVDEAANHIRDMVDADANIIFGSAFNEELNGKLRVSVVATGIDAEASSDGAVRGATNVAAKPSLGAVAASFGGLSPAQSFPKAEASEPASRSMAESAPEPELAKEEADAEDQATDEVKSEVPEMSEAAPAESDPLPFEHAADEDRVEPEAAVADHNVTPLRMTPPEPEAKHEEVAAERPYAEGIRPVRDTPPAQERGPSLFERMTSIGKGKTEARRAREDLFPEGEKSGAGEDPLEIPAFFKRQVND